MIQAVPAVGTHAQIPLHMIRTETQIRMRNGFDEASLTELANSIREHGVIEPIIVRPTPGATETDYTVIAGERRFLAASIADLYDIPAVIMDVSDEKAAVIQAIENIQRENLTVADTAEGVAKLVAHYGSTGETATALGKSKAWVSKHCSLTKLHADVRPALLAGVTQDAELLLTMNKIRRLPDGRGLDVFKRLMNGLEHGTTSRHDARKALASLEKANATASFEHDNDDPAESEGETADDAKQPPTYFTLTVDEAHALLDLLNTVKDGYTDTRNALVHTAPTSLDLVRKRLTAFHRQTS